MKKIDKMKKTAKKKPKLQSCNKTKKKESKIIKIVRMIAEKLHFCYFERFF